MIEIILVTNVLFILFDGVFAVIMLGTFIAYLTALIIGSEWVAQASKAGGSVAKQRLMEKGR